jgi:phenylalanyl-tRNA synthetase alpha chain
MTLEEKAGKSLEELGTTDAQEVARLFGEAEQFLGSQENEVLSLENDQEFGLKAKALRDFWLSRKNGLIAQMDKTWLKGAPKQLRPIVGFHFNSLRGRAEQLEERLDKRRKRILKTVRGLEDERPRQTPTDLTLPGYRRPLGSFHPVTRVQREIEDIFLGLGFSIETGPEIESVYYNFDALNIPETHPSRDDWDTLYIDDQTVLRTHTSPAQMRAMEKRGAPLYIIAPGKCYRHDKPDSTHSPMFHQIEGLAIDTDITFGDLKGTLDFFAKKFFGEKVRTRFNPSFFPFTEPSGEVSASCPFCDGRGCRRCKESGWIELLGCGMVHPDVLRYGGIDPDRYSGWAFGLGIDRFAMVKYDITDIQLFFQSDVRFLEQF